MSNFYPRRYTDASAGQELKPDQEFIDYGDAEEYYNRDAFEVAREVFGEDKSRAGRFYSAGGSDEDVPFKVESRGDGQILTYNMLGGEDELAGWQGLDGHVISRQRAEKLAKQ